MITQIWDSIQSFSHARQAAAPPIPGDTPALAAERKARHATARARPAWRKLARRLRGRRDARRWQDELAALTDDTRADLGLGPKPPRGEAELRFIATPERLGSLPLSRWR